jgi:hypothetical protein
MSCGTTIRVLFSRALSHPKHSLPDSVPIESEEERDAREADEMVALDSVGDYEADPNVMLEDVPQDIVIKTLKVSCACVPVLVFARVCVCVRARDVDMCS